MFEEPQTGRVWRIMGRAGVLWYVLGMVCFSLGGTGSCGVRYWICGVVCRVVLAGGADWGREQRVAVCHALFQLVCYQEGFAHGIPRAK